MKRLVDKVCIWFGLDVNQEFIRWPEVEFRPFEDDDQEMLIKSVSPEVELGDMGSVS